MFVYGWSDSGLSIGLLMLSFYPKPKGPFVLSFVIVYILFYFRHPRPYVLSGFGGFPRESSLGRPS